MFLMRVIETIAMLKGDQDAPLDEESLAKEWGVCVRTAYRTVAAARSLVPKLRKKGITVGHKPPDNSYRG